MLDDNWCWRTELAPSYKYNATVLQCCKIKYGIFSNKNEVKLWQWIKGAGGGERGAGGEVKNTKYYQKLNKILTSSNGNLFNYVFSVFSELLQEEVTMLGPTSILIQIYLACNFFSCVCADICFIAVFLFCRYCV